MNTISEQDYLNVVRGFQSQLNVVHQKLIVVATELKSATEDLKDRDHTIKGYEDLIRILESKISQLQPPTVIAMESKEKQ